MVEFTFYLDNTDISLELPCSLKQDPLLVICERDAKWKYFPRLPVLVDQEDEIVNSVLLIAVFLCPPLGYRQLYSMI